MRGSLHLSLSSLHLPLWVFLMLHEDIANVSLCVSSLYTRLIVPNARPQSPCGKQEIPCRKTEEKLFIKSIFLNNNRRSYLRAILFCCELFVVYPPFSVDECHCLMLSTIPSCASLTARITALPDQSTLRPQSSLNTKWHVLQVRP